MSKTKKKPFITSGHFMLTENICLIIPTYNSAKVLMRFLVSVLPYAENIVVVNDGSTDTTEAIIRSFRDRIHVLEYAENKGKGFAIRQGLVWAINHGFKAAITIDSDCQHFASDIPLFINQYLKTPKAFIVGTRSFDDPNIPRKNVVANRISNFWFAVETFVHLRDTQTGFRLYPLEEMGNILPYSHRYEAELELLVRCAWRNIQFEQVPIHVCYPPEYARITHFRHSDDFIRISILNVILCAFAIIYGYPSRIIRRIFRKRLAQ